MMEIFNLELAGNRVNDEILFKLPKNVEVLIENNLYVYSVQEEHILHFCFLEFAHSNYDGSDVCCTLLMRGWGVLGGLNECRHTYWGDDGYIYYLNGKHIKAMIQWLENIGFKLD